MNKKIIKRINDEANYIINSKKTVRELAKMFHVSKSTVHKDLQERLKDINVQLHKEVMEIFQEHIKIRHINGGEATKNKYKKIKEEKDERYRDRFRNRKCSSI